MGFILTLNDGVKGKKITCDYEVSEVMSSSGVLNNVCWQPFTEGGGVCVCVCAVGGGHYLLCSLLTEWYMTPTNLNRKNQFLFVLAFWQHRSSIYLSIDSFFFITLPRVKNHRPRVAVWGNKTMSHCEPAQRGEVSCGDSSEKATSYCIYLQAFIYRRHHNWSHTAVADRHQATSHHYSPWTAFTMQEIFLLFLKCVCEGNSIWNSGVSPRKWAQRCKQLRLTHVCFAGWQTVEKILDLLGTLDRWINETPPVDQPSRFGNKAYRTWYSKLDQVSAQHTHKHRVQVVQNVTSVWCCG